MLAGSDIIDDLVELFRLLDKVEGISKENARYQNNGLVPDDIFMSKREQIATTLASGMLARGDMTYNQIPEDAVDMADELIAEANKNAL